MSGRVVYFDLASGAGGDMLIAALADAGRRIGVDVESPVAQAIGGLGCSVSFTDVHRGPLASLHCGIKTDERSHAPGDMRELIARADTSDRVKARALRVIDLLVSAEASVHGVAVDEVHLHELGSLDTAADAIGAAVAIETLGIESVAAAHVPMPNGWVGSDHGPIPVPAPATAEILRGAAVKGVATTHELVTPSAAAILVAHDCEFGTMPSMTLGGVGVGAGTAEREVPNVCRAFVGATASGREEIVQLETNIDDQTPEALGYAIETLLAAGAVDAWVTPIVMKRSRPSFALSVLTHAGAEAAVLAVLFRETTTLGVRRRRTERWVAEREEIVVTVGGECVRVKVAYFSGERVGATPEFSDCVRASEKTGSSLKDVYAQAAAAAQRALIEGARHAHGPP